MTLNLSADLWQSLLCFPLLDAAWEKVRANGGCYMATWHKVILLFWKFASLTAITGARHA